MRKLPFPQSDTVKGTSRTILFAKSLDSLDEGTGVRIIYVCLLSEDSGWALNNKGGNYALLFSQWNSNFL